MVCRDGMDEEDIGKGAFCIFLFPLANGMDG